MNAPELHLTGAQVRATIQGHAKDLEIGFTEALEDLSETLSLGRSTLFLWIRQGTPRRRERIVRRFYAYAVRYSVKKTADHEAAVFL